MDSACFLHCKDLLVEIFFYCELDISLTTKFPVLMKALLLDVYR
jgi:hypothetical protein